MLLLVMGGHAGLALETWLSHQESGTIVSAEWTLPWLPGALAGVNRSGLAGAVMTAAADDGGCAAPAFLFLQNCLQQFETVENAAEWCERRPAGGRATLCFSDAVGGHASVVIDGAKRFRGEPAGNVGAGLVLDPGAGALRMGEAARLEA